jgi:hypothetical protein
MCEFGITNIKTQESRVMFGYNIADAYRRSKLDMTVWYIDYVEYID